MARRELLSLSVWNERMHERLLQTVESGVRVLPWGSLFRAIDFHPPPTISPPNTTKSKRERGEGRGRWDQKEIDGWPSSFFLCPSFFPSLPAHYFCILLVASFPLLDFPLPATSLRVLTNMHLCQVLPCNEWKTSIDCLLSGIESIVLFPEPWTRYIFHRVSYPSCVAWTRAKGLSGRARTTACVKERDTMTISLLRNEFARKLGIARIFVGKFSSKMVTCSD